MYYNVVYTDLMIKGLVRVFVSFQKENVFIALKKRIKAFVVMQMRHTRLRRFILPEQVFTIIFCTLAAIFVAYSANVLLCKITPHWDQLCHAVLWICPVWPTLMSTHTLFSFTCEFYPSSSKPSLALCLLTGVLQTLYSTIFLYMAVSERCSQSWRPAAGPQHVQVLEPLWNPPLAGKPVTGHKSQLVQRLKAQFGG